MTVSTLLPPDSVIPSQRGLHNLRSPEDQGEWAGGGRQGIKRRRLLVCLPAGFKFYEAASGGITKGEKLGGSGLTSQALRPAALPDSVRTVTLVFVLLTLVRGEPPRELRCPRAMTLCSPRCSPHEDRAFKRLEGGSTTPHQVEGYGVRFLQDNSGKWSEDLLCLARILHGAGSPASANTCHYPTLNSFPEILNIYCHHRHFAQLSGISAAIPKASFFYLT